MSRELALVLWLALTAAAGALRVLEVVERLLGRRAAAS